MKGQNITVSMSILLTINVCRFLDVHTLKTVFYIIIFSKASVIVNVFKQNNDQNISAVTSKQANMFQLLISKQIFFKIS